MFAMFGWLSEARLAGDASDSNSWRRRRAGSLWQRRDCVFIRAATRSASDRSRQSCSADAASRSRTQCELVISMTEQRLAQSSPALLANRRHSPTSVCGVCRISRAHRMPLWLGVTGRVRPAREAAAVEEIKRSSANRAGPLPNQDRRRADRNRIRRTRFDDDVALPGGRRSANEHRHAPRSDRAADV